MGIQVVPIVQRLWVRLVRVGKRKNSQGILPCTFTLTNVGHAKEIKGEFARVCLKEDDMNSSIEMTMLSYFHHVRSMSTRVWIQVKPEETRGELPCSNSLSTLCSVFLLALTFKTW